MIELAIALTLSVQAPSAGERHIACLTEYMNRFEASQESASDIAVAVVTACRQAESPMDGGALANLSSDQRNDLREFLRETMKTRVVTHIVRLRACRRTPNCSTADLPLPFGLLSPPD